MHSNGRIFNPLFDSLTSEIQQHKKRADLQICSKYNYFWSDAQHRNKKRFSHKCLKKGGYIARVDVVDKSSWTAIEQTNLQ